MAATKPASRSAKTAESHARISVQTPLLSRRSSACAFIGLPRSLTARSPRDFSTRRVPSAIGRMRIELVGKTSTKSPICHANAPQTEREREREAHKLRQSTLRCTKRSHCANSEAFSLKGLRACLSANYRVFVFI